MPDKVHCARILVKTEQEAKAVLERLNKGEKFANIAGEVSLCSSGKRGGDLGTFGTGKIVKEFETAAFALKKGEISPISENKVWIPHNKTAGISSESRPNTNHQTECMRLFTVQARKIRIFLALFCMIERNAHSRRSSLFR